MKSNDAPGDESLDMALATLIRNTRTTSRAVSLPEIAKWLEVGISHLGSTKAVADRIGLSAKMLRQFLAVKDLAPAVREKFARRELDSVDMAAHLKMLSSDEQELVSCDAARRNLDTADVRAVVEYRKEHPDLNIAEVVERVKSTKNIRQYVIEFVVRGPKLREHELLARFGQFLSPKNMVSLEVKGSIARLIVNQHGRMELQRLAREKGMSQTETVNTIASADLSP